MNEKKHNEKHIPGYFLIEWKQQQKNRFMLYDITEILLKVALSTIKPNLLNLHLNMKYMYMN